MGFRIKRQAMLGLRRSIALVLGFAAAVQPAAAATRPPIVMELFTAQGCTGCPAAARVLDRYAERKGVLTLTFPVDYWDYLGWRDTFAQPAFTDRQRAYARRLKVREIYTPEIVLDGRHEAPGLDRDRVEALLQGEMDARRKTPPIRFLHAGSKVEIGAGPRAGQRDEVWLVRYDPTSHAVKVRSGENKGKIVQIRNVVQDLARLGWWSGERRLYSLPEAASPGLKTVILIQAPRGGAILAAARG